eukprot:s1340_g6.t1
MAPPRVVLVDLPPAERERMLSFLVANKVEFKPDISGKFSAVVKVVRPEAASPATIRSTWPAALASAAKGAQRQQHSKHLCTDRGEHQERAETPGAAKGTSLTAVQSELRKRFQTFTGLLPALGQHPKTMTKDAHQLPGHGGALPHSGTLLSIPCMRPSLLPSAELLSFMEEVYTARYNQDLLQIQQHAEAEAVGVQKKKKLPSDLTSFPQSVVTVAGKRYGLRRMVGQVCWSVAKSVELHRAEHEGIETFARFLEEQGTG